MKLNFTLIATAGLIGVTIALFGLNFWHASKCAESKSPEEIDEYIDALNKRLLEAESQSLRNTILVNKMLHLVQVKLVHIEAKEIEELSKESQDEAVRLALLLAKYPAPPMLDFEIDPKYKDSETLADIIDDVFRAADDKKNDVYSYSYSSSKDEIGGSSSSRDSETITDAEATKKCTEWKVNYSVVTGVSWGNLPYDLQQKWLHFSCDYHLSEDVNRRESSTLYDADNNSTTSPHSKSENMKDDFTI